MLDPNWTPEAGYSHADKLLEIIKQQEREEREAENGRVQDDDPLGG